MHPTSLVRSVSFALLALVALGGCVTPPPNGNENDNNPSGGMTLTSPSFEDGDPLPDDFSRDGLNLSPALQWEGVPEGTVEFALLMDDPDSNSRDPFPHWLIYNLSSSLTGLAEDIAKSPTPPAPAGALQGVNGFDLVGYDGPQPPEEDEPHTYRFRLFALDAELGLTSGRRKSELFDAMEGHILAEAVLEATFDQ